MERDDAVEVFQRERFGLVRLAHTITGSNALAEDIVQDAYLRWRGRTDVASPGAYLRTVVVNLYATHCGDVPRPSGCTTSPRPHCRAPSSTRRG